MSTHTSMLHVRVDDDIKRQAAKSLAAVGMSVSEAVRLFLHRVVAEHGFPFELKVPNARTQASIEEAQEIIRSRRARRSNQKGNYCS